MRRFAHLPFVLAQDGALAAALGGTRLDEVRARLEGAAAQAGVDAIFLMDRTGLTIAASNHASAATFEGNSYAFRPYFIDALRGQEGRFYGIGATTRIPGYFLAGPVTDAGGDGIAGVIAVKVGLGRLEGEWSRSGETVLLVNADGVVILASDPDWRYATLDPIPAARRAEIDAARQFAGLPLDPLPISAVAEDQVMLDEARYLSVEAPVGDAGWRLIYLAREAPLRGQAWGAVVIAAALALALGVLALARRSRRIGAALAVAQADRTALRAANRRLETEIEERRAAETRLARAQDELARTSRLAALGKLAASVTHELGQPITAMRTYLTVAEMGDARAALPRIGGILERMQSITDQLKFFSRPVPDGMARVDLRDAVRGALDLLAPTLAEARILPEVSMPEGAVPVRGNAMRLEQVLVNVIRNAADAVAGQYAPAISVTLDPGGTIRVADNGPGLGGQSVETLVEPFHTTRASGEGMGLGLAISAGILADHGGRLDARDGPEGGAVFTIALPLDVAAREAAE
ncbi:ATP-binding protein [Pseudaestuariivita atlantica]|uniref:sensor histidine kinase n=1 Tax=Pseudaestuariivita atlantica TaxID=1317121 RepID=UPI00067DD1EF